MKLVFYSSGEPKDNLELDKIMLSQMAPTDPQITFIPSESSESEIHFQDFIKQYQKLGVQHFIHMPIDIPIHETMINKALQGDIIHLSGGNTYYFLHHLKRSNLLGKLKKFVASGGILTGTSAGGIIMTPSITTAGFPTFDCDDNYISLKNLTAMSLVNFEFFPHYKKSKRYDQELASYSKKSRLPLLACPDGTGVIINGDVSMVCGKLSCFYQGKKINFKY
jgi:dipeptidase E